MIANLASALSFHILGPQYRDAPTRVLRANPPIPFDIHENHPTRSATGDEMM